MNEEETRRLAKIIRKGHPRRPGSAANRARNKLVEAFMPLANRYLQDPDKHHDSLLRLINSAETWDPAVHGDFKAYAKGRIRVHGKKERTIVNIEHFDFEDVTEDTMQEVLEMIEVSELGLMDKFILIRRLHGDTQQLIAEELSVERRTIIRRESEAIKKLRGMVPR